MTNDADDGDDDGGDDDDDDDGEKHGDVGQIAKPIVCTRAALPPVNLSITALQMMDRPLQNTKETKSNYGRDGRDVVAIRKSPRIKCVFFAFTENFPTYATLYKYKEI